jgi:hypothetical protein
MKVGLSLVCLVAVLGAAAPSRQEPPLVDPLHKPLDEILDVYVRDGLVYYNALRQERGKLDRYIASLAQLSAASLDAWTSARRLAYWINAYNAFVLQLVIDNYPIRGRSSIYPANSIRQIPGSFERRTFRAGGRTVTLDQIEKEIVEPFGDPRAVLALGRGALGSGRLKSEAYTDDRLDGQLGSMLREVVDRREIVFVDRQNGVVSLNPIFSWREPLFVQAFASKAEPLFGTRSPIERAVLAMIQPLVVPSEAEFLHENHFKVTFHDFDWRLNDLTGR